MSRTIREVFETKVFNRLGQKYDQYPLEINEFSSYDEAVKFGTRILLEDTRESVYAAATFEVRKYFTS